MIAQQRAAQQGHQPPGETQGHRQGGAEQHQAVENQTVDVGGNFRCKGGGHHKAQDRPVGILHGVEGAPLGAIGAVAGGDVWLAALEDSLLVPIHKGISHVLTVGVIKAQAVGVTDDNDVQVFQALVEGVQLLGDFRVWVPLLQHVFDRVQRGDVGGGGADQAVGGLHLPVDVQDQAHPHGQEEQDGGKAHKAGKELLFQGKALEGMKHSAPPSRWEIETGRRGEARPRAQRNQAVRVPPSG